jgi:hypothetical protein
MADDIVLPKRKNVEEDEIVLPKKKSVMAQPTITSDEIIIPKKAPTVEPVKIPDDALTKLSRGVQKTSETGLEGTLLPGAYRLIRNTLLTKIPETILGIDTGKYKGNAQDITRQLVADSIGTGLLLSSVSTGTYPAVFKVGLTSGAVLGGTGAGEELSKGINAISDNIIKKLNIKPDTDNATAIKLIGDNIPNVAGIILGGAAKIKGMGSIEKPMKGISKPLSRELSEAGKLATEKEIPFTKSAEAIETGGKGVGTLSQITSMKNFPLRDLIYPKNLEGIIKSKNPTLYANFKDTQNKALLKTFDDIIGENLSRKSAFDVGLDAKKSWGEFEKGVKKAYSDTIDILKPKKINLSDDFGQFVNDKITQAFKQENIPLDKNGNALVEQMTKGENLSLSQVEMLQQLKNDLPKQKTLENLLNYRRNFSENQLDTFSKKYPNANTARQEKIIYELLKTLTDLEIAKSIKSGKLKQGDGDIYNRANNVYSRYLNAKSELKNVINAAPEKVYDNLRDSQLESLFEETAGQEALQNMALNKLERDVIKGDRIDTGKLDANLKSILDAMPSEGKSPLFTADKLNDLKNLNKIAKYVEAPVKSTIGKGAAYSAYLRRLATGSVPALTPALESLDAMRYKGFLTVPPSGLISPEKLVGGIQGLGTGVEGQIKKESKGK